MFDLRMIVPFVLALFWLEPVRAEVVEVDNAELARLIADGVPVIDVRTPGEWATTGVVEGSHLLTFFDAQGKYDAEAWLAALSEIVEPGQPVAFICASGGRTQVITRFLDGRVGLTDVHNVTRGINAWIAAGRVTVAPGDSAPATAQQ